MRTPLSKLREYIGGEVEVCGWIEDKRELKNVIFLTLRDCSGKVQVTVKRGSQLWDLARKITRQTMVIVRGRVGEYMGTVEVVPTEIVIGGVAKHPLPIDPSGRTPASLSTILDARPLSLRIPEVWAVFSLRSKVTSLIRRFFEEEVGCIEVHTPKLIASGTEGGADLFEVDYFGRSVYLAQSPQLYKEQLMLALGCVYEIAPYFRAEKSHTRKHLNEFISVDFEMAFIDYHGAMKVLEDLINYVLENVRSVGSRELEILKYSPPKPPGEMPRVSYDEVLDILSRRGFEVRWGEDIPGEALEEVYRDIGDFYFIVDWPWEAKPFYIRRRGDRSESFDLMYRSLELASGGTREHVRSELEKNLVDKGLRPESFEFHLRFFDYGMPPHAGFGLGLDRLMLVVTGKNNIREVVLYPRDPERVTP
jgi:aspartyl-tRNA synthetase